MPNWILHATQAMTSVISVNCLHKTLLDDWQSDNLRSTGLLWYIWLKWVGICTLDVLLAQCAICMLLHVVGSLYAYFVFKVFALSVADSWSWAWENCELWWAAHAKEWTWILRLHTCHQEKVQRACRQTSADRALLQAVTSTDIHINSPCCDPVVPGQSQLTVWDCRTFRHISGPLVSFDNWCCWFLTQHVWRRYPRARFWGH